jgi:hypothetical protein
VYAPPADSLDPDAQARGFGDAVRNGFREIFGLDDPARRVPEQPQSQPPPAPPPPEPVH